MHDFQMNIPWVVFSVAGPLVLITLATLFRMTLELNRKRDGNCILYMPGWTGIHRVVLLHRKLYPESALRKWFLSSFIAYLGVFACIASVIPYRGWIVWRFWPGLMAKLLIIFSGYYGGFLYARLGERMRLEVNERSTPGSALELFPSDPTLVLRRHAALFPWSGVLIARILLLPASVLAIFWGIILNPAHLTRLILRQ